MTNADDETVPSGKLGVCALPSNSASDPGTRDLELGTRIGPYILRDRLGAGGMGTVYKVEDSVSGEIRALKLLKANYAGNTTARMRFEREAHTGLLIRHPNIVRVFDMDYVGDCPYMAMELLKGLDLRHYLSQNGRLKGEHFTKIFDQLCAALTAAHVAGVVHRDIKPSNVFLPEDPERLVVLLDFGIAKVLGPGALDLTATREQIGSFRAMAPEQITGGVIGPETDIYALGALVCEMLTGQPAFPKLPASVIQYMKLNGQAPRPSERANVPAAVDDVVARAMSTDPKNRYATVSEFRLALLKALGVSEQATVSSNREFDDFIAIHVEIVVDPEELDDPDDELLDDMESVLPMVDSVLEKQCFRVVLETGNAALFVRSRTSSDSDETMDALVKSLLAEIENRESSDERVKVGVSLHVAPATLYEDDTVQGPIMELHEWLPEARPSGLFATPEAKETFELGAHLFAPEARG